MIVFKNNPHDVCGISSPYGYRTDPLTGARKLHDGIDIRPVTRGKEGDPLYAVNDGVILISKTNNGGLNVGLGHYIDVQHEGFKTRYAHLQKPGLPQGTKVRSGQIVGYMGNTGRSTGAHLHFGVHRNDVWVNPAQYLLQEVDDMTEEQVKKLIEESRTIYKKVSDLPGWARPSIEKMLKKKVIHPDSDGSINVTHEMVRILVMMDRLVG
jgi:hypothetical protein